MNDKIEAMSEELEAVRFNLRGDKPFYVGKWVGVAGGILGGLNAHLVHGASIPAAAIGALAGGAVGYATGSALQYIELTGTSGKILTSASAGLMGAGVALSVTDLFGGFAARQQSE